MRYSVQNFSNKSNYLKPTPKILFIWLLRNIYKICFFSKFSNTRFFNNVITSSYNIELFKMFKLFYSTGFMRTMNRISEMNHEPIGVTVHKSFQYWSYALGNQLLDHKWANNPIIYPNTSMVHAQYYASFWIIIKPIRKTKFNIFIFETLHLFTYDWCYINTRYSITPQFINLNYHWPTIFLLHKYYLKVYTI